MNSLRQIVAENPRMGSALLGSILVHIAVLVVVSSYLSMWHTRRVSPSDFQDPLRARIVATAKVEEREVPSTLPEVPVADPAPQERPGAVISRPGPGPEAPARAPEARELPAQPAQVTSSGEPGPPFGVQVRETLFVRPYPRRFTDENPLLNGQGYVRDVDLEERPRPITLVIPEYPSSALARKMEGWVTIAFFLDEKGEVVHAWPVEGSEEFRPFEFDLMAPLRQSSFTPGRLKGKPVKSITFQTLRFNPEGWPERPQPQNPAQAPGAGPN
jgi:outer membrane biosynthesis protein TonB